MLIGMKFIMQLWQISKIQTFIIPEKKTARKPLFGNYSGSCDLRPLDLTISILRAAISDTTLIISI